MRHVAGTVGAMLAILLALLAQSAVALWRALPEIEDTARAVYHSIAGVCRHTLAPTETEAISLAAFGLLLGVLWVLLRFAHFAFRWWRQTRRRLAPVLHARVTHWPADVTDVVSRLSLTSKLDLVDHAAPFAFCHGLLCPRLCLSTGLARIVTPAELEAVLLHEDHHRRRRDPLLLLITSALAHALFFVPMLRDLYARYDAVKEFDADAAAVHHQGGLEPMAGALYKVLSCTAVGPDLNAVAVGGLSVTERRIDHLFAPRRDDTPALSRRRLVASGLSLSAISLPLLALSAANMQPIVHACRF